MNKKKVTHRTIVTFVMEVHDRSILLHDE